MNKLTIISILLLFFAFESCKSTKVVDNRTSVSFNEIGSGANSNYTEFTTIEIRTFEELSKVWVNFYAKYDRKPPIPNIDFDKSMLLAVALGEKSNGSYSVKIISVLEMKKNIAVTTEENKPGSSCNSTSMMVYPFHLVEIPTTKKPFLFEKSIKVNECGKGY